MLCREVTQCERQCHIVRAGQVNQWVEVIIPVFEEREYGKRAESRADLRDDDVPVDPEIAGAVYFGTLDEFARDLLAVLLA